MIAAVDQGRVLRSFRSERIGAPLSAAAGVAAAIPRRPKPGPTQLIDWSTFRRSAAVREASAAARCERAAAGLRHSRAPIRVESRCGAVSLESFCFHIPLVKPDGRFSRIRLSDKALRFSPTAGSQSAFPAGSVRVSRRDTRRGILPFPLRLLCACRITIDGADTGYGYPLPDRLCSRVQDKSSWPSLAVCGSARPPFLRSSVPALTVSSLR